MKFCFFGDVSNSLKGKTKGGGELQVALLAKALALKGHSVVIIDPYSSEGFITKEGINVINIPSWNKGMKGFRLFWYRIPSLYRLFKEQNADYYYGRMRTYFHLVTYFVAKKIKKKYILAIASDIDVMGYKQKFKYEYKANLRFFRYLTLFLPGDIVFNYVLKRADYVVLQHSGQDLNLTSIKGKKLLFPNIIELDNLPVIETPSKNYFIYLGSLTSLKGSDKLFQLINITNKVISFVIVGQPGDELSIDIFEKIKKMDNVVIKGRLNHYDALSLVANAKALINTSKYEGFPNVFLEAWALGIPVISLTVNPGNVINNFGLGICCQGDLEKMKLYIENNSTGKIDKKLLQNYINDFHQFNNAADRFINGLTIS